MIESVSIRGFRNIESMIIDFERLTTLVGRNDVGKSNVARALNLFFNGQTDVGISFNPRRDLNEKLIQEARDRKKAPVRLYHALCRLFCAALGRQGCLLPLQYRSGLALEPYARRADDHQHCRYDQK